MKVNIHIDVSSTVQLNMADREQLHKATRNGKGETNATAAMKFCTELQDAIQTSNSEEMNDLFRAMDRLASDSDELTVNGL